MSYESRRINGELKKLVKEFNEGFKTGTERSREAYVRTLAPGATVPAGGKFYDQASRDEFSSKCQGLREKARDILDGQLTEIRKQATAAPSADAVNSIQMLSMRKNITAKEVDDLLQTYGDNPMAYRTITDIAHDHGLYGWDKHPIEDQLEQVEYISRSFESAFTTPSAERGLAGDGFCSMLNAQIDGVFDPK